MNGYIQIAGGYSYAPTKIGKVLRNPAGKEVYFQPGDGETEFLAQIDAIAELPESKIDVIADMVFSEYFCD